MCSLNMLRHPINYWILQTIKVSLCVYGHGSMWWKHHWASLSHFILHWLRLSSSWDKLYLANQSSNEEREKKPGWENLQDLSVLMGEQFVFWLRTETLLPPALWSCINSSCSICVAGPVETVTVTLAPLDLFGLVVVCSKRIMSIYSISLDNVTRPFLWPLTLVVVHGADQKL